MTDPMRAHMVSVTTPGLPDENTVVLNPYAGFFEYQSEQVFTPSEGHQVAPGVDIWEYTTPRVIRVDVTLEALVSLPSFTINTGLYFGLELWSEMHDLSAGSTARGVCRFHRCKLESFEFGVWHLTATPVEGTHEIYRAWVQQDTDSVYKKEES